MDLLYTVSSNKKLFVLFALLYAAVAFAAVDVNKATAAELDAVKGIGPAISGKILDERKKGEFKNWADFIGRVKGLGEKSAAKFSAEGLTVSGAAYTGPGAAEAKADAKKTDKPVTEKVKDGVKGAAVSTKETVKEVAKDVKTAVTPKAEPTKPAASAVKK